MPRGWITAGKRSTAREMSALQKTVHANNCRQDDHVYLSTFTKGERVCQYCQRYVYCPGCNPDYSTSRQQAKRTIALRCPAHREAEGPGHAR